jgi:hypothetical protein
MLDSEADSDAILIVSDSGGNYLDQFGRCIVRDGALAAALYELESKYAVTIPLYGFQYSTGPRVADMPPLPTQVLPPDECESTIEQQLLRFVSAVLEYPGPKSSSRVPEVANLTLEVQPNSVHSNSAFRYFPGDSDSKLLPKLVADINRPKDVASELAENIVPFMETVTSTHAWLESETGYYFQSGDESGGWMSISISPAPDALSPREAAHVSELLEQSFVALQPAEKAAVKRYAGWFTRVTIQKGDGDIRKHGSRGFYLPVSKAARFWRWVLDDISVYAPRITELKRQLRSRLGVSISERPNIRPKQYREFLEDLTTALRDLPDTDLEIRLEYYAEPNNAQMLALWRSERRIGSVVADIRAQDVAAWIKRIPRPN